MLNFETHLKDSEALNKFWICLKGGKGADTICRRSHSNCEFHSGQFWVGEAAPDPGTRCRFSCLRYSHRFLTYQVLQDSQQYRISYIMSYHFGTFRELRLSSRGRWPVAFELLAALQNNALECGRFQHQSNSWNDLSEDGIKMNQIILNIYIYIWMNFDTLNSWMFCPKRNVLLDFQGMVQWSPQHPRHVKLKKTLFHLTKQEGKTKVFENMLWSEFESSWSILILVSCSLFHCISLEASAWTKSTFLLTGDVAASTATMLVSWVWVGLWAWIWLRICIE